MVELQHPYDALNLIVEFFLGLRQGGSLGEVGGEEDKPGKNQDADRGGRESNLMDEGQTVELEHGGLRPGLPAWQLDARWKRPESV